MKTDWEAPQQDIRIEILPLIDVIFCILTFFILASVVLTRQSGINVDLPSAASSTTQMREMRIVSIDPVGQLYWERTPITEARLVEELQTYKATNPLGLIVLYASRSTEYREVVDILDLLRQEWGDQVALATQPEQDEDSGFSEFDDSGFPEDFDPFEDSLDTPTFDEDSLNQELDESDNFFDGSDPTLPGQESLDNDAGDDSGTEFPGPGGEVEQETVSPSNP